MCEFSYCAVQVDGDGLHDDDGDDYEKEEMDGTEDPMDFSDKKCLSTQAIKQMNNEISTEEMEGVDGLQDYQMDDGNQVLHMFYPSYTIPMLSDVASELG
jgi:hypothetical protein